MSKNKITTKRTAYTASALAVGLVIGGVVGLLVDNLIIFSGGGMVVGLAIGYALDNWRIQTKHQQNNK